MDIVNKTPLISPHLFTSPGINVYAVLDGASVYDLIVHLERYQPKSACLYRGELPLDLQYTAPYLVQLQPKSQFTTWLLERGWGNHWGIFAASEADLVTVRKHFRTFLMVQDEDGKSLYFRYYDPRVFRAYLPTCNSEEQQHVFGPILYYVMEGEDPAGLLRFALTDEGLDMSEALLGKKTSPDGLISSPI